MGVTPGAPKMAVPGFVICGNCGGVLDEVIRPWRHRASNAEACNPTLAEMYRKPVES